MRHLVHRALLLPRTLRTRWRQVQTPGSTIETSALFDLGFVREQLRDADLREAEAASVCRALASDPSLFEVSPSPLFDAAYYCERYADVAGYGTHPFVHFLRHGFYEARQPHPALDLVYLWSGLQRGDGTLDHPDQLPAAVRACDPHPLISNGFLRDTYGAAVEAYPSPLEFYLRATEPKVKEASIWFSPGTYLDDHPEVAESGRDPLIAFLASGDSLGIDLDLVRGVLSAHGLKPAEHRGPLPWPLDAAGYQAIEQVAIPDLAGPMPNRSDVVVGVVLYHTDEDQLARLVIALDREAGQLARYPGITVRLELAVNDDRAGSYQSWLDALAPSSIAVRIDDSGANVGFGRAHNRLMATAFSAGADAYVGLNPDGFPLRVFLENLLRLTRALDDAALIEADTFPVGHPKWFDPVSLDSEWVSGAAFLMPRSVHAEVGGFDERFFMYCEDVDLSWRVREAGFRTVVCPTAVFYHDVAPRLGVVDPAATRAMFLSARLLGHKWGDAAFVRQSEEVLIGQGLLQARDLPALPDLTPIGSEVPDFSHGLRFALSRYW